MVSVLRAVGLEAILASLAASGLATTTGLAVISVDAVRARAGLRWETKQAVVRDFADREFRRQFSPADQLVPLNDCDFLIVQPSQVPIAAHARAITFLRAILEFFLGQSSRADIRVARVSRIGDDWVEQEPLTPEEFDLAEQSARASVLETPSDPLRADHRMLAAAPREVRRYDVHCSCYPIWSLNKAAIVSYRLKPAVYEREAPDLLVRAQMFDATLRERIGIDLIVLEEAITLMTTANPSAKFGLHAPLHIGTMNSAAGRQAILARLSATPKDVSGRLVVILEGLDAGVPRIVIDAATAALSPFVLAVIGQAPTLAMDPTVWRGTRLSAITCDLERLAPAERDGMPGHLERFAARAESAFKVLIAYGVSNRAEALAAWAAGFTELSGDVVAERARAFFQPVRFAARDLYGDVSASEPTSDA